MDPTLEVSVEFYSGSMYAERPRAICWGEERFEVDRVIERWKTPEEMGFLVHTVDEKLIELRSVGETDCWRACFTTEKEK